jgi:NAD(P) transhydrogenase subunit alpha
MVADVSENGRLTIGVPRETVPDERRVALVPDIVKQLVGRSNVAVLVETGAGHAASFPDAAYEEAGATIAPNAEALYAQADMIVKVQRPQYDPAAGVDEVAPLRDGSILIAPLQPLSHPELIRALAAKRIVAFSLDAIPRITRAQSMDILSSQSTVSGYKAVLLAADNLPKFFPMLTTAAGSITPAKALIIGAGVAGLQAIATARRLGAVVESYDTRPVVKEQVESLGAKFVDVGVDTSDTQTAGGYAKEVSADVLRRQQDVLADHAAGSDVVITTALVPGRPAPRHVSAETVGRMRQGSVIVDLAAETGGNCELTVPGEVVHREGVTIIGLLNLPSLVPVHASQMFAKNIQNLLALLVVNGEYAPDYNDEVVSGPEGKGALITRDGDIVNAATRERLGPVAAAAG